MTEQPRRARHLMDPDNPRRSASPEDLARLERVQRVVMSVLVGTTIFHLSIGLVIAGVYVDEADLTAQIGLCVLAGVCGVLGIAAAFAIHRRSPVTPWALLGVAPGVVGVLLVLR